MNDKPASGPPSRPSNSGALVFLIALVILAGIILAVVRMNKADNVTQPDGRPHDLNIGPQPSGNTSP